MYRNVDSGEIWTTEEIKQGFNAFREESEYMSQFDSFEDYLDDQIRSGVLVEVEEVEE